MKSPHSFRHGIKILKEEKPRKAGGIRLSCATRDFLIELLQDAEAQALIQQTVDGYWEKAFPSGVMKFPRQQL